MQIQSNNQTKSATKATEAIQQCASETADLLQRSQSIRTVAIAQITTDPGQLRANLDKVIETIEKAKVEGAQMVIFPELTLPGYSHMDLAYNKQFRIDQLTALEILKPYSEDITVFIGHMIEDVGLSAPGGKPHLHNAVTVLHNGEVIHSQEKMLLPDYGVHSEARYYQSGDGAKVFQIGDLKLGLAVCEDIWGDGYTKDPTENLIGKDIDLMVTTNASPFSLGKLQQREEILSSLASKVNAPVVYANLIGAFDGYDSEVVFDGRSMVVSKDGSVACMAKGFEEDLLLFDVHEPKQIALPEFGELEELHDALVLGIREYFRRNGFSKAYIGLSGGIDSALVAALAVEALGAENVIGITMPSHITSGETKGDAHALAENLGMRCLERSIQPEYQAWLSEFQKANAGKDPEGITKQNKQARIRGTILMEHTNEARESLVLSTGNKTELALGYCTLYGDMCGGLAAISDVDKLQVYALSHYINEVTGREIIPSGTLTREPSAELEEDQKDADNLPAAYEVLTPLVNEIIEDCATRDELLSRYPEAVVDQTLRLIDSQEYKRRQAAPGIRVSKRGFGIERRIPMAQGGYRTSDFGEPK